MISSMMFLLVLCGVSILLCRLPLDIYLAYSLISELFRRRRIAQ